MERFSYVAGRVNETLKYGTLPGYLDGRAISTPDKPAYIFRDFKTVDDHGQLERSVVTFAEAAEKSIHLASSLLSLGIRPNDNVLILAPNCPEYVYFEFACLRISVKLLRLATNFAHTQMVEDVVKKFRVKVLILGSGEIAEKLKKTIPNLLNMSVDTLTEIIILTERTVNLDARWRCLKDLFRINVTKQAVVDIQDHIDPDDPAIVFTTSGSTGTPKFVLYTQWAVVNGFIDLYSTLLDLDKPDFVYLSDRPFSWGAGTPYLPALTGHTMVSVDIALTMAKQRVGLFLDVVREEFVTDATCMTYLLYDLMVQVTGHKVTLPKKFQTISLLGEMVPLEALEFARHAFDRVIMSYGLTEGLSCLHTVLPRCSDGDIYWMDPEPYVEIKVTDPESGRILPPGQNGNLHIRSPHTMVEYYQDADMTNRTLKAGWVSTGDVAVVGHQGRVKVIGRKKDLISRGGNKVYPSTIEAILLKHPKVFRAVVVGVPDKRLFHEVCACVVAKPGVALDEEELRQFCQQSVFVDKNSLILPRYFMILDDIPKGSTGKVDKKALIQNAIQSLQLA